MWAQSLASGFSQAGHGQVLGAGRFFGGFGPFLLSYGFTNFSDDLRVQFADNARLPGIQGPVDLNVYCCARSRFPLPPSP